MKYLGNTEYIQIGFSAHVARFKQKRLGGCPYEGRNMSCAPRLNFGNTNLSKICRT